MAVSPKGPTTVIELISALCVIISSHVMLDVNVAVPNISFVCKIDPIEGMLPSGFLNVTDDVFMTSNTSLRVVILHRSKNNFGRYQNVLFGHVTKAPASSRTSNN